MCKYRWFLRVQNIMWLHRLQAKVISLMAR